MSDIPQLEQRITAALDRIRRGVEAASEGGAARGQDSDEVRDLSEKLAEEKTANAQLEERVRLLKERQDGKLAELESNVEAGRTRAARMDRELQRLRQVNAELRSNNARLREAVAAGVSEPHLVNKAMLAELEALRATRAADAAEMDAILDELTPIIKKEANDAAS